MRRGARRLAIAFCGCFLAAAVQADSLLARLADRVADEIVRTAKGRPVELSTPEDRSLRGLALDLQALVTARLKGQLTLANSGPRLRIASVVSETSGRLSFAARVLEEPAGTLVDLLSASVATGGSDLPWLPQRPAPNGASIEVAGSHRTPALGPAILDVAFLGPDRLLVLSGDEVSAYRWVGDGLSLIGRRPLPGPLSAVRRSGGILVTSDGDDSFWALTSRGARATLVALEGTRLVERQQADAVPWPGAPLGLRYRPGTNLIEGAPSPFGSAPLLDIDPIAGAVSAEGRLLCAECRDLRVGSGLAGLWPGFLAASSPAPPGAEDALLILEQVEAAGPVIRLRLPVEGAVRALAGKVDGRAGRLIAVIEPPGGDCYLLTLDLMRP